MQRVSPATIPRETLRIGVHNRGRVKWHRPGHVQVRLLEGLRLVGPGGGGGSRPLGVRCGRVPAAAGLRGSGVVATAPTRRHRPHEGPRPRNEQGTHDECRTGGWRPESQALCSPPQSLSERPCDLAERGHATVALRSTAGGASSPAVTCRGVPAVPGGEKPLHRRFPGRCPCEATGETPHVWRGRVHATPIHLASSGVTPWRYFTRG